jgi:hypothetical protein
MNKSFCLVEDSFIVSVQSTSKEALGCTTSTRWDLSASSLAVHDDSTFFGVGVVENVAPLYVFIYRYTCDHCTESFGILSSNIRSYR